MCNLHWQRERQGILSVADLKRRPNRSSAIRDDSGNKQCVACRLWLPIERYTFHDKTADGLQVRCKACVYMARHFTQYQIRPLDIARIMSEQNHACAICSSDISGRYVVDHDHSCCPGTKSCGKCVRGFLCDGCNLGLGAFKDSTERLLAAAQYIEREIAKRSEV